MKKALSFALSVIMVISVFTVCVSAASFKATSVFSVSSTSLTSDTVTYTVNVASNTTVQTAVIYAKFDSKVLELTNAGECYARDADGDMNPVFGGVFEIGLKYNDKNCCSVGFMNSSGFKTGTSGKAFVSMTFKVKPGADRTKATKVEFYCDEFNTSIDKKDDDQLIKSFNLVLLNAPVATASVTTGGVKISWNAVSGAASYDVYRSTVSGSIGSVLKNTTALFYTDSTVEDGKTYYYTVKAKNSAGSSEYNKIITIACLPVPEISKISSSAAGVVIEWTALSGVDGYVIYRNNKQIDKVSGASTVKCVDEDAVTGTKYTYTVKGYKGTNYSDASAGVTGIKLEVPAVTVANADGYVKVSWNLVDNATEYYVYRKTGSGGWTRLVTVGEDINTLLDKSAASGTTYYYTVKPLCGSVAGAYKSSSAIKYLATPVISSAASASTGVTIKWSKVTGAAGYYVYRKTTSGSYSRIAKISSGATVSYTDQTAKAGTKYIYALKSINGSFASATSKTVYGMYLPAPKFSAVATVSTGISLKWSKVTGAAGYYVYRKTGSGSYSRIATIKSGATVSYTDKTAKTGVKYTYTLKAYNGSFASVSATATAAARLAVPTVKAAKTTGGIKVTWNKIAAADSYIIYRKTAKTSYAKIATVKGNTKVSYVDKTAKKGTAYYYTVRPVCGSCSGLYKISNAAKY